MHTYSSCRWPRMENFAIVGLLDKAKALRQRFTSCMSPPAVSCPMLSYRPCGSHCVIELIVIS